MTGTRPKMLVGLILFSIIFFTTALAQRNNVVSGISNYEKIYIHFDRPFYNAGETIWFKAYLYNQGLPSMLSNELYLQLIDRSGKIIDQRKYPIAGATVSGDIQLEDSLKGFYSLIATTKTISADDGNFVYGKNLYVYNASETVKKDTAKKTFSLQFFPESGHLVDRIRTQVAFKATDMSGNPIDVSGVIKSDSTTVITPFRSFHDGIGKVSFTPRISESLFAEVNYDGRTYTFSLPNVEASGVNIKITDGDSIKTFDITRSKTDKSLFDSVRLIVSMNNDTVYENRIGFGYEQTLSGILKTNTIPSGILNFRVLNKDGIPIAERLCFVNNKEYLVEPDFVMIKRDSAKKMKNIFELRFSDTIQRSFSISVTDIHAQEFPEKENIMSRLLFTSDLRGYIHNPGYYFAKNDAETRTALDNVMLTHGWTRYNWKRKSQNNSVRPVASNLLYISGTVNDFNTGKPVSGGTLALNLITEDSSFQAIDAVVDNNGKFRADSLMFFGTAKIIYSYTNNNHKRNAVSLTIDAEDSSYFFASFIRNERNQTEKGGVDYFEPTKPLGVSVGSLFEAKFKQLSTVFVKTKIKRPEDKMNEKYASPLFRTSGKIILDNVTRPYNDRTLNVVNYILTNIRTLNYDRDVNSLVNRKNFSLQTKKNWIVSLLLNESPTPLDIARTITMDRVALIKFYEAGFVGVGTSAPGGAVAVYLKKTEDDRDLVGNTPNSFLYKGYSITKDFYSPDYSMLPKENSALDNRLTLYWDPSNCGTTSKTVKFDFFNNDVSKKLNIIIEGFDAKGRLLHYEKEL